MLEWLEIWRRKREEARSNRLRRKNDKKPPNHKGWGKMIDGRGISSGSSLSAANMHDRINARKAEADEIRYKQKSETKDSWK